MNINCCERAELPCHSGRRTNTLVVTCAELGDLPTWNIRRFLGPFMTMRSPGAIPDISESNEGKVLAELLMENRTVKHLVICAHSLCLHFGNSVPSRNLCQSWRDDEMGSTARQLLLENPDLRPKHRLGLLQQRWLCNMVRRLRAWSVTIGRPDLEIHAWIYEPEMEWISALDQETDIFVPLNACTKLIQ